MNILFVIKKKIYSAMEPLGILYLSSVLKKNGHNVFLSNYSFKKVSRLIEERDIGILGISCMNTDYKDYLHLSQRIKESFPKIIIVWGGPTPTYNPEIISQDSIDIICRGEGENALLELANRFERKQQINDIPNLWVKNATAICKNDVGPLVPLDSLSFPDRSLTKNFPQFIRSPIRSIMTSRGCPFSCSFCFNDKFRQLYRTKGEVIRTRSVDNVMEELCELKVNYNAKFFYFTDDIFPFQNNWLDEFSEKYSRKIRIPFTIVTSVAFVDENLVSYLKKAGCVSLHLAIECGNEEIRRNVLNKKISNNRIKEAVKIVKKNGLAVCSYNMIGIPFSTFENDIETLDLNLELNVDVPHLTFCVPFLDTELGKIVKNASLIHNETRIFSWFEGIPIQLENKKEREKFGYLFPIVLSYPFLRRYLFILLKIPVPKFIIKLLKDIVNGYKFKKKIVPIRISLKEFFYTTIFFLSKRFSK